MQIPWEAIINFLYFAIGLGVGLLGLYQSQRYFLADQQQKFDEIRNAVTTISQKLAVIEGVTSRLVDIDKTLSNLGVLSDNVQGRLFSIVEQQVVTSAKTEQATIDASDQIKALVADELTQRGVATTEVVTQLEGKLDTIFGDLTSTISRLTAPPHVGNSMIVSPTDYIRHRLSSRKTDTGIGKEEILEAGDIRVDMRTRKVAVADQPLSLSHQEYVFLVLLLKNFTYPVKGVDIASALYKNDSLSRMNSEVTKSIIHEIWMSLKSKLHCQEVALVGSKQLAYYILDKHGNDIDD